MESPKFRFRAICVRNDLIKIEQALAEHFFFFSFSYVGRLQTSDQLNSASVCKCSLFVVIYFTMGFVVVIKKKIHTIISEFRNINVHSLPIALPLFLYLNKFQLNC